jgi:hypothetical protein
MESAQLGLVKHNVMLTVGAQRGCRASWRLLGLSVVPLLFGVVLACSDATAPIPTVQEVTVRVDVAEVLVTRSEPNGYNITVPLTIVNGSTRSLFYNGFCFAEMERSDGGAWTAVGFFRCDPATDTLRMIPPDSSGTFGYGQSANGPDPIVPDFAQSGTYRLRVRLYLDNRGRNQLPNDFGISNPFTIFPM